MWSSGRRNFTCFIDESATTAVPSSSTVMAAAPRPAIGSCSTRLSQQPVAIGHPLIDRTNRAPEIDPSIWGGPLHAPWDPPDKKRAVLQPREQEKIKARFDPFERSPLLLERLPKLKDPASTHMTTPSASVLLGPQVTRHVGITNIGRDMDTRLLIKVVEQAGDVKIIYPDFLHSSGMLIISYYDLRHAAECCSKLYSTNVKTTYLADVQLSHMVNVVTETSDCILMTLCGARERLGIFDYIGLLQNFGAVRHSTEIKTTDTTKVILVSFYDERAIEYVQTYLHDKVFQDIRFQVSQHVNKPESRSWLAVDDVASSGTHWPSHTDHADLQKVSLVPRAVRPTTSPLSLSPTSHGFPAIGAVGTSTSALMANHPFSSGSRSQSLFAHDPFAPSRPTLFSEVAAQAAAAPSPSSSFSTSKRLSKDSDMMSMTSEMSMDISDCNESVATDTERLDNTFDIDRVIQGKDKRTTFMIRNIPNKYTQQMLIECINATHKGTYDFLYLRIDFKNRCNVGYAFINFIDVQSVVSFARERVGKRWNRFNSEKRCALSYANIQGKEALIEKFKNSNVMEEDESYRPKIFCSSGPHKGEERPFPSPTVPFELRRHRQQMRQRREVASQHHHHPSHQPEQQQRSAHRTPTASSSSLLDYY
ncbi:RNA recognition motif 2-domain-containing protein [Radiomyces spectabilis]|uniref:RNA recognition motif 2-domain-containing protein n=1 Tax=Radiomyces spectabilis TaxID=64574 RepID=UPI00221F80B4|nr:RNA recognition motif 2-domain-containing protein [Radiomyces spectabilis]KAI8393415.1 RNA recognition motif 2-domain-containing protein [Radiomyces spectabilis]